MGQLRTSPRNAGVLVGGNFTRTAIKKQKTLARGKVSGANKESLILPGVF